MFDDEFKNDLQENSLQNFLLNNRGVIFFSIITVISLALAYIIYDHNKINTAKKDFIKYNKAILYIDNKKYDEGLSLLNEIIKQNNSGYARLAKIYKLNYFYDKCENIYDDLSDLNINGYLHTYIVYNLVIAEKLDIKKYNNKFVKFNSLQELEVIVKLFDYMNLEEKNLDEIKKNILLINDQQYIKNMFSIIHRSA